MTVYKNFLFLFFVIFNVHILSATSQVTVCTQNLHNYGLYSATKGRQAKINREDFVFKEKSLIKRFSDVDCDIIAFQELLGNDKSSKEAIKNLSDNLKSYTGKSFDYYIGRSNDKFSRVGFLVAKNKVKVLNTFSYSKRELPKLLKEERPRYFTRGPFEINLEVKKVDEKFVTLTIITFHFKSQSGGYKDPAKLNWEILRMQSAEGLRQIAEEKVKNNDSKKENILILLGDRNSNFTSSSSKILDGTYLLSDFSKSFCMVSKKGIPICKEKIEKVPKFISVLTNDPEALMGQGSYIYKKQYSWLDEILISASKDSYALENKNYTNNYDSGVFRKYENASDHALGFVRLHF